MKKYETIIRKTVDAVNKQDLTLIDEVFARITGTIIAGFKARK